jgi:pimeloyl-ACP methyl ester carboxylesterase
MSDPFLRVPSDGLELAVETFGTGPWLVFAHGLTGNRHVTRRQFTPLAERFRVVIYDQRGHCDSTPVTDPTRYDLSRMSGDMQAVMNALGIGQAVVGGESMGAATTLHFALRWPERVRALLLTAPAFSETPNPDAQMIRNMSDEITQLGIECFLRKSAERQRQQGASAEVIATIAEMHRSHDSASLATACRACIEWLTDDIAQAGTLRAPACVIGWPDDPLHPLELAQRLVATLPSARLVTLSTVSQVFAQPGEVGRIYGQFLSD